MNTDKRGCFVVCTPRMSINPGLEKSLRLSVFIRVHLRTELSILATTAAAISASTCLASRVLAAIQPVEAVGQAVGADRAIPDFAGVAIVIVSAAGLTIETDADQLDLKIRGGFCTG
jgi:hypothetical protein